MRGSLTTFSLLVLLSGCIPSLRMVHEGDRYFEYCYGADFDRRVTPPQNEACWQAWLAHYSRYQPAHRVDYAMRRMEALQAGEPALRLPGLSRSAGGDADPEQQALLQTAQTGAPPQLEPAPTTDAGAVPIPNGCTDACNAYEARCASECPNELIDCRRGCTRERAICLGGCH